MSLTFLTEKDIRGVLALALIVVFMILGFKALALVGVKAMTIKDAMLVISFVGNLIAAPIAYYFGTRKDNNGN